MLLRPPVELTMIDEWSCTTCVAAQVLYMFGKLEPPFDLPAIDRRIGRTPGQPCDSGGYYLEWLRHGLNITGITDFDTDRSLGPDGLAYVHEYYADKPDLLRTITPERFLQQQEHTRRYQTIAAQLPGKRTPIKRRPVADDIPRLLAQGYPVVLVSFPSSRGIHFVIAYGMEPPRQVKLYDPGFENTLTTIDLEIIRQHLFLPQCELIALSA